MTYVTMTSTLASADDAFHSGVTTALRGNVIRTQRESRVAHQSIFQSELSQSLATTFAYYDSWIPFPLPIRNILGAAQPRTWTLVVDAKLSSASTLATGNLQVSLLPGFDEPPTIDGTSGILSYPKAEFQVSASTYALYSDDVTPWASSGYPYFYAHAVADKVTGSAAHTMYIRGVYLRESATS
ncbi:MAG: hypothetical protein ACYTBJ_02345 [Planctomycetota bacterium]|jgi:hypothetical protein